MPNRLIPIALAFIVLLHSNTTQSSEYHRELLDEIKQLRERVAYLERYAAHLEGELKESENTGIYSVKPSSVVETPSCPVKYESPAQSGKIFATHIYRRSHLDGNTGDLVDGSRSKSNAFAVGYKRSFASFWLGGSISYESTKHQTDFFDLGAPFLLHHTDEDAFGLTLFGGMSLPQNWHIAASASAIYSEKSPCKSTTRSYGDPMPLIISFLPGDDRRKMTYAASIEIGKTFFLGTYKFAPYVGIDTSSSPNEWFRYRVIHNSQGVDIIGPRIGSDRTKHAEIPIGFRLAKTFAFGKWEVSPSIDATLVHSIMDKNETFIRSSVAVSDGNRWRIYDRATDDVGGSVELSIGMKYGSNIFLNAGYTYEAWDDYRERRLSAQFGLTF